eukprot:gene2494-4850_t
MVTGLRQSLLEERTEGRNLASLLEDTDIRLLREVENSFTLRDHILRIQHAISDENTCDMVGLGDIGKRNMDDENIIEESVLQSQLDTISRLKIRSSNCCSCGNSSNNGSSSSSSNNNMTIEESELKFKDMESMYFKEREHAVEWKKRTVELEGRLNHSNSLLMQAAEALKYRLDTNNSNSNINGSPSNHQSNVNVNVGSPTGSGTGTAINGGGQKESSSSTVTSQSPPKQQQQHQHQQQFIEHLSKEYEQKIRNLEEQISSLQSENKVLLTTKEELNHQFQLTVQKNNIKTQKYEEEILSSKNIIKKLQKDVLLIENIKVSMKNQEIELLRRQHVIDDLQRKLSATEKELTEKMDENTDCEAQVQSLTRFMKTIQDNHSATTTTLEENKKQLHTIEEQLLQKTVKLENCMKELDDERLMRGAWERDKALMERRIGHLEAVVVVELENNVRDVLLGEKDTLLLRISELENTVTEYHESVREKDYNITCMEAQCSEAELEINALRELVEQQSQHIETVSKEGVKFRESIVELEESICRCNMEICDKEECLYTAETALSAGVLLREKLECEVHTVRMEWSAEKETFLANRLELENNIQNEQNRNYELLTQMEELNDVIETLRAEVSATGNELEDVIEHSKMETERSDRLNDEMKALQFTLEIVLMEKIEALKAVEIYKKQCIQQDSEIYILNTSIEEMKLELIKLREDLKSRDSTIVSMTAAAQNAVNARNVAVAKGESLSQEISNLNDALHRLENDLEDCVCQRDSYRDELKALRIEVEGLRGRGEELMTELEDLKSTNDDQQTKLEDCTVELELEKRKTAGLSFQASSAETKIEVLTSKVSELEAALTSSNAERRVLLAHSHELREQYSNAECEQVDLMSEIAILTENKNTLTTQLKAMTQTKEAAVIKACKLEEERHNLTLSNQILTKNLEETITRLEREKRFAIEELESEKKLLDDLLRNTQYKLEEKLHLIVDLQGEVSSSKVIMESLENTKKDLTSKVDAMSGHIIQIENLYSMCNEDKESEIRRRNMIQTLHNDSNRNNNDLKQINNDLQQRISSLIQERNQLQNELSGQEASLGSLMMEKMTLQNTIQELRNQIKQFEIEMKILNQAKDESVTASNIIKDDNDMLSENLRQSEESYEIALQQIKALEDDIYSMNNSKRQLQKDLEASNILLEDELHKVKKELEYFQNKPKELQIIIEDKDSCIFDLEARLADVMEEFEIMSKLKEEQDKQLAALNAELEDTKLQFTATSDARLSEGRRLVGVLQQLQSETSRANDLNGRVKVLSTALANITSEKTALLAEIEHVNEEKKELFALIQNLRLHSV